MRTFISATLYLYFCAISVAQVAPDFTVTTTEGVTRSLYSSYLDQGKIVVLEFFFTTCPPCNAIAPSVQALNESFGDGSGDVVFLEISVMPFDQNNDIVLYENQHGITYHGVGTDGGSTNAIAPYVNGDFGEFGGTPEFAVINPEGQLHFPISGINNTQTLENLNNIIQTEIALLPDATANFTFETSNLHPINLVDLYANGNPLATNINGNLALAIPETNVTVTPRKSDNPKNGVSTLDMLLITKHILGILPFTNPCQLAAADVNLSGAVTANDLLLMRKLILNIDTSFATGQSWRFFLKDSDGHDGCDSFPFSPSEAIANSGDSYTFEGVKFGDVNGSANPASLITEEQRNEPLPLEYSIRNTESIVAFDFKINDPLLLEGFQLALRFDPEIMQFFENKSLIMNDFGLDCVGTNKESDGELLLNWINPYGLKISEKAVLFSLYFQNLKPEAAKTLTQSDDLLPAEIYMSDHAFPFQIKKVDPQHKTGKVNILQSPVHETLSIALEGIQNTRINCIIVNNQGIIALRSAFDLTNDAGNSVEIPVDNLPSGFYTIILENTLQSGTYYSSFIKL